MADHTKTDHVTRKAGIWTGCSCKRTRYISLPKSNSSVHADRTLMIIKKERNNNVQICLRTSSHIKHLCTAIHNKAKINKKMRHKAESVSYFSTRNLLATLRGGGPVLDDLQCAAQKPLVMMVSLAVAAQLGLTQPVQ